MTFFASPAFAGTPPPSDINDVPTYPQLNDPEVLQALPHLGAEVSSLDWFGMPAVAPWIDELPPSSRVARAMKGSSPSDTALRTRDALGILLGVIHALGASIDKEVDRGQPRAAAARYVLYRRWLDHEGLYSAQEARASTVVAAARRKSVRDQVLATFLSSRTQALYRATPDYDAPVRESEQAARTDALAPKVAQDNAAGVDRAVFGIPLGSPLRLPECQPGWRSATTCLEPAGGFVSSLEALSASFAPGRPEVKVGTEVIVRLADDACPDWVKEGLCRVYLTVDGGYAIAARFWTSDAGSAGLIKKKLEAKYRQAGHPDGVRACTNNLTGIVVSRAMDWSWALGKALYVSYSPLAGENCSKGAIRIETGTYHRLQQGVVEERAAKEPTL